MSKDINIKNIILSYHIIDMVRKYKGDFSADGYTIVDNGTFPLNRERLHRILEGIRNGDDIPPVKLKKTYGNHEVLDGRHRIAGALILGIPVVTSSFY
jgi:hypothetical protein